MGDLERIERTPTTGSNDLRRQSLSRVEGDKPKRDRRSRPQETDKLELTNREEPTEPLANGPEIASPPSRKLDIGA